MTRVTRGNGAPVDDDLDQILLKGGNSKRSISYSTLNFNKVDGSVQNTETYSLCSGKSPFFAGATRMVVKKIHICQLLLRCDAGEEVRCCG